MVEYGLHTSSEDLHLLINRMDKDKDSRIGYAEFKQGLVPQNYMFFQQNAYYWYQRFIIVQLIK